MEFLLCFILIRVVKVKLKEKYPEAFEGKYKALTTGCFNKIYPIFMFNSQKPRVLMSLCIISYKF